MTKCPNCRQNALKFTQVLRLTSAAHTTTCPKCGARVRAEHSLRDFAGLIPLVAYVAISPAIPVASSVHGVAIGLTMVLGLAIYAKRATLRKVE